jgi:hypothetical protein
VTGTEGRPTRTDPYLCASPRRSTGGQISPPQRYLFLRCRTPTTAGDSRKASAAGPALRAGGAVPASQRGYNGAAI